MLLKVVVVAEMLVDWLSKFHERLLLDELLLRHQCHVGASQQNSHTDEQHKLHTQTQTDTQRHTQTYRETYIQTDRQTDELLLGGQCHVGASQQNSHTRTTQTTHTDTQRHRDIET